MAASVVAICNSALIKIGSDLIVSLTDNNKRAILCNEQYSKIRDEVLRAHPWTFARKRVSLSPSLPGPAFEYANSFTLPTDCLKILTLDSSEIQFKKEGNKILCDETTLNLKYTARVEDTTLYDPDFSEALACRLASDLAFPITQSIPLQQAMWSAYKDILKEARLMNAQEGTPDPVEASEWTTSRF